MPMHLQIDCTIGHNTWDSIISIVYQAGTIRQFLYESIIAVSWIATYSAGRMEVFWLAQWKMQIIDKNVARWIAST